MLTPLMFARRVFARRTSASRLPKRSRVEPFVETTAPLPPGGGRPPMSEEQSTTRLAADEAGEKDGKNVNQSEEHCDAELPANFHSLVLARVQEHDTEIAWPLAWSLMGLLLVGAEIIILWCA